MLAWRGLDGIENKINPGEPAEKDLYDLEPEGSGENPYAAWQSRRSVAPPRTGPSVSLKGGVFSKDLIEAWIGYKRTKEVDPMRVTTASVRVNVPVSRMSRNPVRH